MYKILLAFLFLPLFTIAQTDSGTVQFYVYPDYSKIILNNTRIVKPTDKVRLPIGKHIINISGSKLLTITEEVNVVRDSVLVYRKIMPNSVEYLNFKNDLKKYNIKKAALLTCIGVSGVSTVLFSYNYYSQTKSKRNQALENAKYSKSMYESSYTVDEIEKYRDEFNSYKTDYNKYNNQMYYAVPMAIVGGLVTYKLISIYSKIKKPKYVESLSFNFYRDLSNTNNFTVNYKF